MNHNEFSHTKLFQNSLMALAHLIIWHLICLYHIHYSLQCFSVHLNGHTNDFLDLCDAYVYAVPFLVRTMNLLKIVVRF